MSKNRTTQVRALPTDKEFIKQLAREMAQIEKKEIRSAEVLRRTMKIPNLKEILLKDSEMKRMMRK